MKKYDMWDIIMWVLNALSYAGAIALAVKELFFREVEWNKGLPSIPAVDWWYLSTIGLLLVVITLTVRRYK